jgi:DNA-binding FrmR family transcriptional regulator
MKQSLPVELHQNIDKRLQRLEGQVRGIRRMLEDGRDCQDILTQLAAIRGAAHQISLRLMENYALECVHNPTDTTNEKISKMVNMLGRLS